MSADQPVPVSIEAALAEARGITARLTYLLDLAVNGRAAAIKSPSAELGELNRSLAASTVALGTAANPHPRRSECPSATTEAEVCVCGHPREAHEHHRPGMNCSLCHCPSYTSAGHS